MKTGQRPEGSFRQVCRWPHWPGGSLKSLPVDPDWSHRPAIYPATVPPGSCVLPCKMRRKQRDITPSVSWQSKCAVRLRSVCAIRGHQRGCRAALQASGPVRAHGRHSGTLQLPDRSSWELPDLQEGKIQAISDSDGVNYPWYGNTTETCTIVGPTKRDSKFIISMNDNFYPSVTWAVPVSESNVAKLTNIYRDQSFTTWLVATNTSTNDMIILQTLHWRMQLSIEVNPNRPLGQRARLREPIAQDQPKILSKNEPIPPSALVKPNANDAQVLMWRPKYGQPLVVIPPKHR
ncbi:protein FAM78A isoform X1 [Pan paniscus]|uniref:protein FAM78A isoform X1 n=1 Tax=Pan paniscus TaxID=9597 RepID=UPI0004F02D01|nr:protein FAM78A isoform X1 [Pan paniscus]XP_009455806.2 protein FAM78A isoform X2 [Pan troglodytes]